MLPAMVWGLLLASAPLTAHAQDRATGYSAGHVRRGGTTVQCPSQPSP